MISRHIATWRGKQRLDQDKGIRGSERIRALTVASVGMRIAIAFGKTTSGCSISPAIVPRPVRTARTYINALRYTPTRTTQLVTSRLE
jgi:hypothetical protein